VKTLSSKQQHIIDFVSHFWVERSYPPTVRDILAGCKLSSTSVVDYNLRILESEGYLQRRPEVSRGISLPGVTYTSEAGVQVPVIGQIAAGKPIPVPT